jgi:hypothetical protein
VTGVRKALDVIHNFTWKKKISVIVHVLTDANDDGSLSFWLSEISIFIPEIMINDVFVIFILV